MSSDASASDRLMFRDATAPAKELTDGPEPEGKRSSLWSDAWRQLRRNPIFVVSALLIAVFTVMAIVPGLFTDVDPESIELSRSREAPSSEHWFGLDIQGRDIYSRIIHGARNSITIGLMTSAGAAIIALLLGSIAGYYGKGSDAVIARLADVFLAIPTTLAGIAFLNIIPSRNVFTVSGILIAFSWPTMMRIVRSSVLQEKEKEYVQAARALGASDLRIIMRHILPNSLAPMIVVATILVGVVIGAEATLSFLGVGLKLPTISWGLMVSAGQQFVRQSPHLVLFPGIFISATVFSFVLMGDALRDALDPRLR